MVDEPCRETTFNQIALVHKKKYFQCVCVCLDVDVASDIGAINTDLSIRVEVNNPFYTFDLDFSSPIKPTIYFTSKS